MVKNVLLISLLAISLQADILDEKVRSFIDQKRYMIHSKLIERVFSDRDSFIYENRVDILKVTEQLKENGLLNLFYGAPRELEVSFETGSSPMIFMHLVTQSLKRLGYYYFTTKYINYENGIYLWKITLESEHAIDPTIFIKDLRTRGVMTLDVVLNSEVDWLYKLEIREPILVDSIKLVQDEAIDLKRNLNEHWVTFEAGYSGMLEISSHYGNSWYPHIVFFDENLNIIKTYTDDNEAKYLNIDIGGEIRFAKIGDLYTDTNIKNGLKVIYKSRR